MKFFKSYVVPILLATIIGVIVFWGFDSFESQDSKYFIKTFIKCLFIPLIIVVVLNLKKSKTQ
jgi:hypothetical protein